MKYISILPLLLSLSCNSAEMAGTGSSNKTKPKDSKDDQDIEKSKDKEKKPKDDDDDDVDEDPTVEGESSLEVSPKNVRLFKGESFQLKALFKESEEEQDVTDSATWTTSEDEIIKVSKGLISGITAGQTKAKAEHNGKKKSAEVLVVKCKDYGTGSDANKIRVKGENWPGNNIDAGGADFDDYFVVLTGSFTIEGYQIFSKIDQEFTVDFSIGSTGSTSQTVKLQAVDCDGTPMDSVGVSSITGQLKIKASKGDRFNLITTAVTGSTTRVYDLLKDNSTAFRVVTE
jgi:hypothetical protein